MQKVIIIGCPGSGKSTFARALQEATGLPLYYLDMMYWNEDRTIVPKPVFLERVQNVMMQDRWIIDGNYSSTMEWRLQQCDTVFFMDYPVEVCLAGVTARRGKPRADMPWVEAVNEEDKEFLTYIERFQAESRPAILELLARYPEKNQVVFQRREDADNFLIQLKKR